MYNLDIFFAPISSLKHLQHRSQYLIFFLSCCHGMPHSHVYDKLKSAVHQISLILSSCLIKLFHLTHFLSPLSYCRSDKYIFLNILNFPIFCMKQLFFFFYLLYHLIRCFIILKIIILLYQIFFFFILIICAIL